MHCPFCGHADTQVKDSRPSEDGAAIRRRRYCIGCGQRFTTIERIERIVTGIVRQLEASGDAEVSSKQIGELVMETLKDVDAVAYVRFASVYRNFREAKDFEAFVESLDEAT
jgi:transcriptional repressor NrdR